MRPNSIQSYIQRNRLINHHIIHLPHQTPTTKTIQPPIVFQIEKKKLSEEEVEEKMMKLSMLQQSFHNRRINGFRSTSPFDSSSDGGSTKSPAAIFWLVFHGLCCLISLVLGFRFSRLVFFLLFSTSNSGNLYASSFLSSVEFAKSLDVRSVLNSNPERSFELPVVNKTATNSRVVVGRHGIRIRPWPHPDPIEVMKAHQIMERVQTEQKVQFGVKEPKTVIAVTPTYVRTFQALHLTGVMHSLMLVPYNLIWIVVEAGGVSNETAVLIGRSGLKTIHIGFNQQMPNSWEERHKLESKMRLQALRIVREKKLDGIVMFADDSNMHSMELYDEIQNVKSFGAVSVGILLESNNIEESDKKREEDENRAMPIQGPACNSSNMLSGWHTFNAIPYIEKNVVSIDDRGVVLPGKLEWSGFVLNSRLLWKDDEEKPDWVNDLDSLDGDVESPLSLLKDQSMVEPLGSCGRQVLIWWFRVEARADSRFPPGWIIDPPLEITVPSKRTPWPDTPPELPSNEKMANSLQEQTVKRSTKKSRKRSSRKRKHETKTADIQDSVKLPEQS